MLGGSEETGFLMALDAVAAYAGREKYGDAVVGAAIRHLISEGRDVPDARHDVDAAADHEQMIAENESGLLTGLMEVTQLLLHIIEQEMGVPPADTLAAVRRSVAPNPVNPG